MPVFTSPIPCPDIPDDLTCAQFLLDAHHPTRPTRPQDVPWLIDDSTGRRIGFEEVMSSLLHIELRLISEGSDPDPRVWCCKCYAQTLGNRYVVTLD